MKHITILRIIIIGTVLLYDLGCEPEPPLPLRIPIVRPVSNAINVWLPNNSTVLAVLVSSTNIKSYRWEKISGPTSYRFEDQNSHTTRVLDLEKGVYVFEITVTNHSNQYSKGIIKVAVKDIPPAPIVKASADTTIHFPYNRAALGCEIDMDKTTIDKIEWKKIVGPDQFDTTNSTEGWATFYAKMEGKFQFQIEIIDQFGRVARDTMTINVLPDNNAYTNNEKLFENLPWDDFWGYTAEVGNISSFISAGMPYKIFLKLNTTSDWEIVAPSSMINYWYPLYSFSYFVDNSGHLSIYSDNSGSGSKVKIVY